MSGIARDVLKKQHIKQVYNKRVIQGEGKKAVVSYYFFFVFSMQKNPARTANNKVDYRYKLNNDFKVSLILTSSNSAIVFETCNGFFFEISHLSRRHFRNVTFLFEKVRKMCCRVLDSESGLMG